jgi:hypothetical protein
MEVKYLLKPKVKGAIAIAGSPGLRSVGLIAVDRIIEELKPKKFAELHSPNFPISYHGIPYVGTTGEGGAGVREGVAYLPKVKFYYKDNLIVTRGYHADLFGQYAVASKVVELYQDLGVEEIITLGGYVPIEAKERLREKREVSYCASHPDIITSEKMEGLGIKKKERGPFLGFSALVLGIGWLRGIKGIGLFGETTPDHENPLNPDPYAAKALLEKLNLILGIKINTSKMIKKKRPSAELGYL